MLGDASLTSGTTTTRSAGTLFDTSQGDRFSDMSYPVDPALAVTADQADFSSSTAIDLVMTIQASNGQPLYFAFDHWTFYAKVALTSFPAAGVIGMQFGARYYVPSSADAVFGAQIQSHGSSASKVVVNSITGGAILAANAIGLIDIPATIEVWTHHDQTNFTLSTTVSVNGGTPVTTTTPYGTGSNAGNTRMTSPIYRFKRGVMALEAASFTADYPNAPRAFIGNSLDIWPGAAPPPTGFAHLLRAEYAPGATTLIAGASGSTTEDMVAMAEGIKRMNPARIFWTAPAINDRLGGWLVSRSTDAIKAFIAAVAPIPVVFTNDSPIGNSNTPAFNTQLAAIGRPVMDIYATLGGGGNTLLAQFNDGSGVHWTDTGAASVNGQLTVKNLYDTFIAANGY